MKARDVLRLGVLACGLGLAACAGGGSKDLGNKPSSAQAPIWERNRPQLLPGMGSHRRTVTTTSDEAQRYFDQGLTLAYAFNHDEAIRSFTEAGRLDPGCSMAWWGVALCHGPHINNPAMPPDRVAAAWAALEKARAAAVNASEVERALIEALAHRYTPVMVDDRGPLDEAYAAAMRRVWERFPGDPDVGTLFAEALMDLRPWDLWSPSGEPRPETPEVLATLERVLAMQPTNPGANHLLIHAVEASPHPERADAAADRLRTLVPGAGHLVHMPAHIDVRRGRWSMAADQNIASIEADAAYRRLAPHQEFYRLYMVHNHHFLAYASMMEGRWEVAQKAAREMLAGVPKDFAGNHGEMLDPYAAIEIEVLMRFGRWEQLLAYPEPASNLPITRAKWRFARAASLAALDRVAEAQREQARFREAVEAIPPGAMMAINLAAEVMRIAEHMLSGEIAYRRGRIDEAVSELRRAVQVEDTLRYMEPPDWIQPVRHTLSAVLLDAGRVSEAAEVYREDLARLPENGWSLFGLAECLKAQGMTAEAAKVRERFGRAWSRADTSIGASCLCVPARK
ncbi:MAG: tetratricopeptide repeat protein [Phycisphaeraceae bacterium]|nr:tetratricopeptide repeat protein [Phycisphaerae bacterium]MBX3391130.1 tetratricopeptide repeat protein [Phycisphaeraceae bacterium]